MCVLGIAMRSVSRSQADARLVNFFSACGSYSVFCQEAIAPLWSAPCYLGLLWCSCYRGWLERNTFFDRLHPAHPLFHLHLHPKFPPTSRIRMSPSSTRPHFPMPLFLPRHPLAHIHAPQPSPTTSCTHTHPTHHHPTSPTALPSASPIGSSSFLMLIRASFYTSLI